MTAAGETMKARTSMAFSCLGAPFLSVGVSSKNRDSIPVVGISVADPGGRSEEFSTKTNKIPDSAYGPVIEIPKIPHNSLALALEICNAQQGTYDLQLAELGTKPYRVTVTAAANVGNDTTLVLQHLSNKGRTRKYKFTFRIEGDALILKWLDTDGGEQSKIEASEW